MNYFISIVVVSLSPISFVFSFSFGLLNMGIRLILITGAISFVGLAVKLIPLHLAFRPNKSIVTTVLMAALTSLGGNSCAFFLGIIARRIIHLFS